LADESVSLSLVIRQFLRRRGRRSRQAVAPALMLLSPLCCSYLRRRLSAPDLISCCSRSEGDWSAAGRRSLPHFGFLPWTENGRFYFTRPSYKWCHCGLANAFVGNQCQTPAVVGRWPGRRLGTCCLLPTAREVPLCYVVTTAEGDLDRAIREQTRDLGSFFHGSGFD